MSGHSKWATIKRKKEATDSKRSSMYAKLLRAVEVAAREGGGNVDGNMTLASAVEKAKSFSVPNDNIERAIKRGTGELSDGARYEELQYEGYAPGGVALLIQALTDNRNRTGQEIRHAFTRHNGNLGEQGSTAWMFARKGLIEVEKDMAPDEDRLLELTLEAGAEDLRDSESSWDIITDAASHQGGERGARAGRHPGLLGGDHDAAADGRPGRRGRGAPGPRADRIAGGPGRRPERLRQLRHLRRHHGVALRVIARPLRRP